MINNLFAMAMNPNLTERAVLAQTELVLKTSDESMQLAFKEIAKLPADMQLGCLAKLLPIVLL